MLRDTARRSSHIPTTSLTTVQTLARFTIFLLFYLLFPVWAVPAAAFLPIDRWESSASGDAPLRGDPITLTWSIVPDGTPVPGGGTKA